MTKILLDEVDYRGLRSVNIGSVILYFFNEALVGVVRDKNAYLMKLPYEVSENEPILPSHIMRSRKNPDGINEDVIQAILGDCGYRLDAFPAMIVRRVNVREIEKKSLELISQEIVGMIDEGLGN